MADYYGHGSGSTLCDETNHALIGGSCDCGRYRRPPHVACGTVHEPFHPCPAATPSDPQEKP